MTDIYSDEYWLNEFTITTADLNRFQEKILRDNTPTDTTSLVNQLIKGRLEYGHEVSPSVLKTWTGKDSVRIWDPLEKWSVGDRIIVPKEVKNGYYQCFIGEIIRVIETKSQIEVWLDGQETLAIYRYGNPAAVGVSEFTRQLVEKKYGEVDYIVVRFGNRIVSALLHALEADKRFIRLEGKWFLKHQLPVIATSKLQSAHQTLLGRDSFVLDDILPMAQVDGVQNETLLKMGVQVALQGLPERFENIGTTARPLWRALPPSPEKAKVKYHAYDPKTYEVLCLPGQSVELQKAKRLMDLKLYKFMVTFTDGD